MQIKVNSDKELVREIRDRIRDNNGYCACALIKSDDTKCMCKEFRDQISDPNFEGFCHCGLYQVIKDC